MWQASDAAREQNHRLLSIDCGTISTPFASSPPKPMNLSTRLAAQQSAEEKASRRSWPAVMRLLESIFPPSLAIVAAILLVSSGNELSAADPTVEVFYQDRMVSDAYSDVSLLPQLPFRWLATVSGGYDDNPNTTSEAMGSAFTQANVTLTKDLRTERTQLRMVLGGGVVYYFDRLGRDSTDYNGNLNLSLQHKISDRLALGAAINATYTSETQFGTDLGSVRRGNYFSTSDTFAARYWWTARLASYTGYLFGKIDYEDEIASLTLDRVDNTLSESFRYSWSQRTTLIAEYRFERIDYDTAPRDSNTHVALGGLEYQFTPRLNGSIVGGASFRKFDQASGDRFIDPNASATLNYKFSPTASLNWTASYSIEEPYVTEVLTQKTIRTRTGLLFSWQPTSRLLTDLGVSYHHDENTGTVSSATPDVVPQEFNQDGFELVLEAKYVLADRIALDLKYAHTNLDSVGGYSRNVYTAGLAFKF